MRNIEALFIAGPWDGRHVMLEHGPRNYSVARAPYIAPVVHGEQDQVVLNVETFTYVRVPFPHLGPERAVYVPEDWVRDLRGHENISTALFRGYVGRL